MQRALRKPKVTLPIKVVVGKGFKMTVKNTTLTEPPAGYSPKLSDCFL